MSDFLIYDTDNLEICRQDFPDKGIIFVCKDPQNRLKSCLQKDTWAVVESNGFDSPVNALGLFLEKDEAIVFGKLKSVAN